MAIKQYLQNESAFGPEDIKLVSRTPEATCKALNVNGETTER